MGMEEDNFRVLNLLLVSVLFRIEGEFLDSEPPCVAYFLLIFHSTINTNLPDTEYRLRNFIDLDFLFEFFACRIASMSEHETLILSDGLSEVSSS